MPGMLGQSDPQAMMGGQGGGSMDPQAMAMMAQMAQSAGRKRHKSKRGGGKALARRGKKGRRR